MDTNNRKSAAINGSSTSHRSTIDSNEGDCVTRSDSGQPDPETSHKARHQNAKHCYNPALPKQNETAQNCAGCQTIDISGSVVGSRVSVKKPSQSSQNIGRSHTNHEQPSYVNISPTNSSSSSSSSIDGRGGFNRPLSQTNEQHPNNQELFISPDLKQTGNAAPLQEPSWEPYALGESPSSSLSSHSSAADNNPSGADSASLGSYELLGEKTTCKNKICNLIRNSVGGAMSQSCNFINMWSANKRRSTSDSTSFSKSTKDVTASTTLAVDCEDYVVVSCPKARRASSSSELDQKGDCALMNRSTSGNHLAPLAVEIGSPSPSEEFGSEFSSTASDVLRIDLENLKLDEEIAQLEREAEYWEQRLEELERRQYADDVPRTLVENIIKHRKELRKLDFEIYELGLNDGSETQDSDLEQGHYDNKLLADYHELDRGDGLSPRSASKFGSRIKPGQENTADILNAVPPSGSLQHRQYLSRASSGTDTSEYSQMPTFEQHSHRICGPRKSMNAPGRTRRQDLYAQVETGAGHRLSPPNTEMRASPVRPNHFKSEFRPPKVKISQDSSSTASSVSPQ